MRRAVIAVVGLLASVVWPSIPTAAEGCQFVGAFQLLHDAAPDVVGDCVEDAALVAGNVFQLTDKGYLYWITPTVGTVSIPHFEGDAGLIMVLGRDGTVKQTDIEGYKSLGQAFPSPMSDAPVQWP